MLIMRKDHRNKAAADESFDPHAGDVHVAAETEQAEAETVRQQIMHGIGIDHAVDVRQPAGFAVRMEAQVDGNSCIFRYLRRMFRKVRLFRGGACQSKGFAALRWKVRLPDP